MLNLPIVLGAAVIPTLVGFIYYHQKFGLGKAWMNAAGVTQEMRYSANMAVIVAVSLVLSIFLSVSLNFNVIHQAHIYSALANQPGFGEEGSEIMLYIADFMKNYGHEFRSFKHGALHGAMSAIMFALPVLGIQAVFERKSFKYIAIHTGYWVISLTLMGGVICQFS